jgi:hypothetical protein
MPKGHTRHWRKRVQHGVPNWHIMLEDGEQERIRRESPMGAQALDDLCRFTPSFTEGKGWTVFNDWLDRAYRQAERRGVSLPLLHTMRQLVFPKARDTQSVAP